MTAQIIQKKVPINASKEAIWEVLLSDETYRIWTSIFCEGSYAETDWQVGSKALFKTPQGDGLVSKIIVHEPCKVISFEHLGILKAGLEDFESAEVKNWQGFKETYSLTQVQNVNELQIEQEVSEQYFSWLSETWDKALNRIKELAEAH